MPRASNKIYYDIEESEYSFETDEMIFYFSKIQRLEKFIEEYIDNRSHMKTMLDFRYGVDLDLNELFDLVLYKKIQIKDFRVYKGGDRICLINPKFVGNLQT